MKLSQLVTLHALFKQERYCFHVWHASLKSNHFEQGSFYLSRKEMEWEKARDNHHSTLSLLKSKSLCPTRQDHPSWKGLVRFTFGRCFKQQWFLCLAHTFRVIVLGAPCTTQRVIKIRCFCIIDIDGTVGLLRVLCPTCRQFGFGSCPGQRVFIPLTNVYSMSWKRAEPCKCLSSLTSSCVLRVHFWW